jgi:probable HAF family extracellular repeat protein
MRTKQQLSLYGAAALVLLVGCDDATSPEPSTPLASAATQGATIVDLGVLGFATDIAPNGLITGTAPAGAFIWSDGKVTYLDTPESQSQARAINPRGMVAGWRRISPESQRNHAIVWDGNRAIDLGTLPGDFSSQANGMNAAGQVVGYSTGDEADRGFVWQEGVMTELPILPGFYTTIAHDINSAGQIVGTSNDGGDSHAFLFENGVMRDLGLLPGTDQAQAAAINLAGQIVGYNQRAARDPQFIHAVLWQNGGITDLGTLPGGDESAAADINSSGQIVGFSQTGSGETHAVRWDNGVATDLGTLPGGKNSGAHAINDHGDIVGFSGTAEPGVIHAVLWRSK